MERKKEGNSILKGGCSRGLPGEFPRRELFEMSVEL